MRHHKIPLHKISLGLVLGLISQGLLVVILILIITGMCRWLLHGHVQGRLGSGLRARLVLANPKCDDSNPGSRFRELRLTLTSTCTLKVQSSKSLDPLLQIEHVSIGLGKLNGVCTFVVLLSLASSLAFVGWRVSSVLTGLQGESCRVSLRCALLAAT